MASFSYLLPSFPISNLDALFPHHPKTSSTHIDRYKDSERRSVGDGIARTICPTGHKRKDQTRWSISRTATNRRRVRSKAIPPSGRQGTDHTLPVDCTGRSARSSQPDLLDDTAGPTESLPHDVSSSVPRGAASSVWICGGSQLKHCPQHLVRLHKRDSKLRLDDIIDVRFIMSI